MSGVRPFLRHAPMTAPLPLVLDSPHSGEHYPDDFDHAPPRHVVRPSHATHVARLSGVAPQLGATLIEAMFPRAYIDANRSLDDIVLGGMLEENFVTSMIKADGNLLAFFERPVAATLGVLTLAVWFLPLLMRRL